MRPSEITSKQRQSRTSSARPGTTRAPRRPAAFDAVTAWVKSRIPARFHKIGDELAKFGLIGIINIGVNFAVVNILWATVLAGSEVKAKAIATVVAATSAYFMNRHWTYRDRPKSSLRREYTLFFAFNLVGLFIEVAVLWWAKYGLHQSGHLVLNLFTGLGILIGTAFRFWAYRTHVFKISEEQAGPNWGTRSRFSRLIQPRVATRATPAKATSKAVARTAHAKGDKRSRPAKVQSSLKTQSAKTPAAKAQSPTTQPARTKY